MVNADGDVCVYRRDVARAGVRAREADVQRLRRRVEGLEGEVEAGRALVAHLRERLAARGGER